MHAKHDRTTRSPGGCCALHRRGFLTGMAGLGAAILCDAGSTPAVAKAPLQAPAIIDVHHHFIPPFFAAEKRDAIVNATAGIDPKLYLGWSIDQSLEEMDRTGVGTSILSISAPGVWFGDAAEARRLARRCNEFGAEMVAKHPGRFGQFAVLPLPDVEGALAEIAYAFDVLKVDGVGLMTSYDRIYPGDPHLAPVMEELNRRRAVVHVHPAEPGCCGNLIPDVGTAAAEYTFDSTRAIMSLLYSGTLTRLPDIRFIFSHGGGVLPMIAVRVVASFNRQPWAKTRVPDGAVHELRKLFYDTAGIANPGSMAALREFAPTSQIVFGSDIPLGRISTNLDGFARLPISAVDLAAMFRTNAEGLFPRFKP